MYDENQNKYVINLISADMKLLSSAVAGDAVYKFSGFDKQTAISILKATQTGFIGDTATIRSRLNAVMLKITK